MANYRSKKLADRLLEGPGGALHEGERRSSEPIKEETLDWVHRIFKLRNEDGQTPLKLIISFGPAAENQCPPVTKLEATFDSRAKSNPSQDPDTVSTGYKTA